MKVYVYFAVGGKTQSYYVKPLVFFNSGHQDCYLYATVMLNFVRFVKNLVLFVVENLNPK